MAYRLYRADRLEVDLLVGSHPCGVLRRLRQDGGDAGRGYAQRGRREPAVRVPVRGVLSLKWKMSHDVLSAKLKEVSFNLNIPVSLVF